MAKNDEKLPITKCPDCGKESSHRVTPMERLVTRARRTCKCGTTFSFILDDVPVPGWKLHASYPAGQ